MSIKYYEVIEEFGDGIAKYHARVGQILYTESGDTKMYDEYGTHVTNRGSINGNKCKEIKKYENEIIEAEEF